MHKSLMSEAESMAFTAASPRDVKPPPQMAMVGPSHGLSQNPVFMGAAYPSRPNSWRTWRPSATFAQGLDPMPDDVELPPPPPHALTARHSGFPRESGVSTAADSSMPEYGGWPPTASNAELTGLAPAPGRQQQQQQQNLAPGYVVAAGPDRVQSRDYFRQPQQADTGNGHESYVTYSETPLATPRTPIVVEGEQLAPQATSQEASPVDNCDLDSGDGGDAGRSARGDDIWRNEPEQRQHRVGRTSRNNIGGDGGRRRVSGINDGGVKQQPEGGLQEAQLGREAGARGGHGGGAQGVQAEPPREQVQQAEQDDQPGQQGERVEQVFEEVAEVERQRRRRMSSRRSSHALSSWDGDESGLSDAEFSDAGFSWSEAASERYMAVPSDGFGLSIIDMSSRHGSRSRRTREGGPAGPSATTTTTSPDRDG